MDLLIYFIPIALALGGLGLFAFLWSLRSGQFNDLDGAAMRILFDDDDSHINDNWAEEGKPPPGQP